LALVLASIFPFYDSSKVDKILGLDPSEELNRMALKVAADKGIPVEFILGGAEAIPLPDNHVDSVLVTYTMCTIPQVAAANKEILRVLKPQGQMIFCEHGLAPDANVSKWQNRIDPYWGKNCRRLPSQSQYSRPDYRGGI
jgi:ubiquinone/menaquinone biosynthesis C-methylase UbiE